jgi:hypothetical protein
MIHRIVFLLLAFYVTSCQKDLPAKLTDSRGVYIVNEGNFNFGNAEVSGYNPTTKDVENNLFKSANGFSLGDVAQSMFINDTLGFVVVNNSQKIEVVSLPSFKKISTIFINGSSPRYLLPINDSIAYVTELYANKIHVINFSKGEVVTEISIPQYTEQLVKVGSEVFVQGKKIQTNTNARGAVFKLNAISHTLVDTKYFNGDVTGLVKDNQNRIWVSVGENTSTADLARLDCYNTDLVLQKTIPVSTTSQSINHLQTDGAGSMLYFTLGDIFNMNIDATVLPNTPLINKESKNIYALGVDPKTDEVYISDALDYVQSSRIYHYDKTGTLVHSFMAGYIAGQFVFNNE